MTQPSNLLPGAVVIDRTADSIYPALAEELAQTRPAVLLTFDPGIPNQAAKNAPTVTVQVLIP